jgi:hypothetical protein
LTAQRAILFLLSGVLVVGFCVAAAAPKPPSTPPLPQGKVTIGGGNSPGADTAANAESEAMNSAGLASPDAASSGVTTQASSRPASGPATLYSDVSFIRTASTRPDPRPQPMPRELISDTEIEQSIHKATDILIAQFDPRTGRLRRRQYAPQFESMETGLDALCVYALMQAGQANNDARLSVKSPFMKAMIESLKDMHADKGIHQTYAHALRATALSVFNRGEDRAVLENDVSALVVGNNNGAYGYLSALSQSSGMTFHATAPPGFPPAWGDHSNSQYGLLGVWSGAEVDVKVPEQYWPMVRDHWIGTQATNGQWTYLAFAPTGQKPFRPSSGTLSMTAAGTASLFISSEYAEKVKGGFKVGREPFSEPLAKSLAWWESGNNSVQVPKEHWGYTLYGIERVGLASGFKFFGNNDWYRVISRHIVDRQQPNGSWGNLIETSYALLFLSRGRHPILMNKLRFDGRDEIQSDYWANRPNDVSYLARFASKQLERPLNWQVVPLKKEWTDWLDSPILYIASHKKPTSFSAPQIEKLKHFVEAGGMIFTNADSDAESGDPLYAMAHAGDKSEFDAYVTELAEKLFPQYKLVDLPADHPIYSSVFRLSGKPKLKAVSNGARLLLVHSPQDLALTWQKRDEKKGRADFEFGVNLFVYAAGKRDLRNRLEVTYIAPPPARAELGTVSIARLQYAGNWSPEPRAWERFGNLLQWKTGTGLDVKTIALKDLKPGAAQIAHLTGTEPYKPASVELSALKAFVEAGGVLLIDDCGGNGRFFKSITAAVNSAIPGGVRVAVEKDHPLLIGGEPGMTNALKLRPRPYTVDRPADQRPAAIEIRNIGRGAIITSPGDLTTGLLGLNTWGINGYEPATVEEFVRNVIFWTLDREQQIKK